MMRALPIIAWRGPNLLGKALTLVRDAEPGFAFRAGV
jgi:hypothetical protein